MNDEHPTQHPSTEILHRHHDGELSAQETTELLKHLQTCAACHAELASLDRLSDMVRSSTEEIAAVSNVDFTQMFAEVERAVAQPTAAAQPANVIKLEPKRGGSRVLRALPTLGALALAAAALLMLVRQETQPKEQEVAMLAASDHAEVKAVRFGSNAGQVFTVPFDDGLDTPVVWIDDLDEEE